jgi:hypothetical protein
MDIYQILESLQRVEESALADADLLIQDIVNGRVDIYDVYANPKDEVEKYVSEIIHKYYDEVVIDTGLHAKDDFEPIFDRVVDQLQKEYKVEFDESNNTAEADCDAPMSLTDKLRARWEKTKREKGLVEVGMTTGGMSGMTTGDAQATSANTQDGQEIDTITKNLQNLKSKVPDINIQKATAALSKADNDDSLSSQDKDAASALADPVANLIKDPQLGQQLQQLISKGMQKDQAAAQLAKQQGGT